MRKEDITVPIGYNIQNNALIEWGTAPVYSHLLFDGVYKKSKTPLIQNVIKHLDESPNQKKILYYSSDAALQEDFIANKVLPYENIRYYDNVEETLFFRDAYELLNSRFAYFESDTYGHDENTLTPVFLVIDDYNSLSKESKHDVQNFVRFGRVARVKVIASYNSLLKPSMSGETRTNFGFRVHCFHNKPIILVEHYNEASIAIPGN